MNRLRGPSVNSLWYQSCQSDIPTLVFVVLFVHYVLCFAEVRAAALQDLLLTCLMFCAADFL